MIKHVGKHDLKKCILLFKEVPGADDMCLIVYTDTLPKLMHDPMMKCVESEVGQRAHDITGPLNRTLMDNGQNLLNSLHTQGYIRKVPTNQMILQPNAQTTIRLDELNKILKQMGEGKEATQKLAELDAAAGLRDPAKSLGVNEPVNEQKILSETTPIEVTAIAEAAPIVAEMDGVLTDAGIAQGQLSQAERMAADGQRLLNEAQNLRDEAYTLAPELKPIVKATRKKRVVKAKAKPKATVAVKRKPGRPRKNAKASVKN